MSTVFTEPVMKGTRTSFREFAIHCMQMFGQFVNYRDTNISDDFTDIELNDYHKVMLEVAQTKLEAFRILSEEEKRQNARKDLELNNANCRAAFDRCLQEQFRIDAMLAKVQAWVPPTDNHIRLKEVMLEQLRDSRPDMKYVSKETEITEEAITEAVAETGKSLEDDVNHHQKRWDAAVAAYERNKAWIKAVVDSLPEKE